MVGVARQSHQRMLNSGKWRSDQCQKRSSTSSHSSACWGNLFAFHFRLIKILKSGYQNSFRMSNKTYSSPSSHWRFQRQNRHSPIPAHEVKGSTDHSSLIVVLWQLPYETRRVVSSHLNRDTC